MGTNYYWHENPPCPTCERPFDPVHIGKSSGGWCFSLHVIPEKGINSLADWQARWTSGEIRDEYGERITSERMSKIVTERRSDRGFRVWRVDSFGYENELDFHRNNHSQRGPNGLLRHQIGAYCVGHGEGTWDLIPGEFS